MKTQTATNTSDEFKDWVKGLLHEQNDLCVVFTKKDGSKREMYCTLAESKIPTEKQPKAKEAGSETARQASESALRVFDTKAQDWRSFRWDSVTEVRYEE